MRVFLDTSVLVAALVLQHEFHERAFPILDRVQNAKDEGYVSAHSLAEVYAVLTKFPPPFRHTPEQAFFSLDENIIKHFKIIPLTGTDYTSLLREAALAGIQGGTVYDAVLVKSASKAEPEKIFTFNARHFQAIAPKALAPSILAP